MLHQFTFKNYKSFKEKTTLDLLASNIKEHSNDVVFDIQNEKVLKVIAIYGANASGKSTVIDAFETMRNYVLYSFSLQGIVLNNIEIEPYWFEEKKTPTEFSVLFSTNENIYQYGFTILDEIIIEEFLYVRDKTKKKETYIQLFERESNSVSGEILKSIKEDTIIDFIKDKTLLISILSNLKINYLEEVYKWFRDIKVVDYGNPMKEMSGIRKMNNKYRVNSPLVDLVENEDEKRKLERFIQAIDVGITKLEVVENQIVDEDTFDGDEHPIHKYVVSYHKNPSTGKFIATPLSNESSGTQKMLLLYIDLKRTLDIGGTIFIDELDAKLHPLLIRYIIIMFHDSKINLNNAQLIFSTQEVFTLDKENLRRDEIWFTDKDKTGISELYSLDSYIDDDNRKVRNDASYGKDYILGKYKSVPSLRRWEE